MSKNTRLARLLDRGFYPAELPPTFRTKNFSSLTVAFSPPENYHGSTTFFDGATFRGVLRTFGVVNPCSYYLLSRFIAENWTEISSVMRLSKCSGARPKFPPLNAGGRAIETASLASKRKSQQHLASSFPSILTVDINRFYGSIYTHSIPWAALGKQEAKRQYRLHTLNAHWSDKLDKFVRNCNQRQTIGIPIGPDTSRIVSEMILARLDAELCSARSGIKSKQVFHNIDDYQIGAFEIGELEKAQSNFVRTISRYELRLNDFKTSIDEGLSFVPSNFQRNFDVLHGQTGKRFVEHFFEILYSVIPQHPNSNVAGYALKRFARALARNPEKVLVREYLQRLLFATPHQARWVMPLLLGLYRNLGANAETREVFAWGVEICARRNDVGNLLWFLYGAIFLDLKLVRKTCDLCIGASCELVDLMLYHGSQIGLFTIDKPALRRRYRDTSFQTEAWLPLYEVERRNWDSNPAFQKLGTDDDRDSLYAELRDQDVEFYSTEPDVFSVTAFKGWRLTPADFALEQQPEQQQQPEQDQPAKEHKQGIDQANDLAIQIYGAHPAPDNADLYEDADDFWHNYD